MSQKNAKKDRKGKPKVEKAGGSRAPQHDPARQRATLQQVNNAFTSLLQQQANLEQKVRENVRQLHQNDVDLKGGLDSSEFNLRAHQKVLNSLGIDLENIHKMLTHVMTVLAPEVKVPGMETRLTNVELEPATEEKPAVIVRRVEWAYYHEETEKDLQLMAEEEKKALEALAAEKKAKEEAAAAAEAKAKEEAPKAEPLPDKHPELPEGAAVFGE